MFSFIVEGNTCAAMCWKIKSKGCVLGTILIYSLKELEAGFWLWVSKVVCKQAIKPADRKTQKNPATDIKQAERCRVKCHLGYEFPVEIRQCLFVCPWLQGEITWATQIILIRDGFSCTGQTTTKKYNQKKKNHKTSWAICCGYPYQQSRPCGLSLYVCLFVGFFHVCF